MSSVRYPTDKSIYGKNMVNVFLTSAADIVVATSEITIKTPFSTRRTLAIVESPNNNNNGYVYRVIFINFEIMSIDIEDYLATSTVVGATGDETFELTLNKQCIRCSDPVNKSAYWIDIITNIVAKI
jgi:hypothetical protein